MRAVKSLVEGTIKNSGRAAAKAAKKSATASAYDDGAALDRVQYLEAKLILKPDRFTSVESFRDFGKIVLYGSRARGDARKNSDWDVAVFIKGRPTPRDQSILSHISFDLLM